MQTPLDDEKVKAAMAPVVNFEVPPGSVTGTGTTALDVGALPMSARAAAVGAPAATPVSAPPASIAADGTIAIDPNAAMPTSARVAALQKAATPQTPQNELDALPGPQTVSTSESRTQIQGGAPINPKIEAANQESRAEQLNAMANVTAIEAHAAKESARVEAEKERALEQQRILNENAAEKRRLEAEAQMKQVRDAQKELDANQGPAEDNVGQRIAKAIAAALGAWGAGMTGGPNHAMQVIENDRAAKMNAWKAQYGRLQGKVSGAQNLYALLRNKELDGATADSALLQNMNERYASQIRQVMAQYRSPIVQENGKIALERLQQENLAHDQALWQSAQSRWSQVRDDKTKTGGTADIEGTSKLVKLANDDEYIKRYRESSRALAKFQDLVNAGADGAALADFIAGKGGLEQGSFGPNFVTLMKKRSVFGQGIEKLRETFKGGVDPALLADIKNGLAAEVGTAMTKGKPSIDYFRRAFKANGIDPRMVTGGETSSEAAATVGAAPSAYQGQR